MHTAHPTEKPAPDSVDKLYSEHHPWLKGWLRRRLNDSEDAADLAQDTFLRVLSSRSGEALREPRHYLATIARGLVIDHYRRRHLQQAYLEALASHPEHHAISAEERVVLLDTLVAIDHMLDGLGARTRGIFLAVQLEGLSYERTAERLGVSVSTVRKHLARALMHCLLLDDA
ncbi:sigma-70 family RNA polymerase sigma factor [Pseudomonas sp. ABC1]|uniref:sigma-70 family RNA polymerase sigma factor n=1 Tax=Pseudomonas sp. ABC1 TaxID=2748080 RepID=UPI0015C366A3|nr:sigma-70 family RNA polymerase sigma factor [Pseudomonas sp. ABC1]QLF93322.1 sigma-70 family RNA polymerase sigma factor [Pseudomonas sp. ABC1]